MAAIPYNNAIPQSTDQFSISQPELLQNFQSIQLLIDVDHTDFTSVNAGQHDQVSLPVQGAAPAFAPGSYGLYNLFDGLNNQLFMKNDFTGLQVPVSKGNIPSVGPSGFKNGYTYLPSGFLIKWGLAAAAANAITPIVFPLADSGAIAIPAFTTACVGVIANNVTPGILNGVLSPQTGTITTLGYSLANNGPIAGVFYVAIGW